MAGRAAALAVALAAAGRAAVGRRHVEALAAESPEAVCQEGQLPAVSGHCILMFAEPVGSFHRIRRFSKGLFGGCRSERQ